MDVRVREALLALAEAFPMMRFEEEHLRRYADELADFDPELVVTGVRACMRSSRFFPTISEIRAGCVDARKEASDQSSQWEREVERDPEDKPGDPEELRKLLEGMGIRRGLEPRHESQDAERREEAQAWATDVAKRVRARTHEGGRPSPASLKASVRDLRRKLMTKEEADAVEDALDNPKDDPDAW